MQYNIQNFNPTPPIDVMGIGNAFLGARNLRIQQEQAQMVQAQAEAAARAKAESEAADRAMVAQAFDMAHKDPTPENQMKVVGIITQRDPAAAKALTEAFNSYNAETQQTILRDSANILTAFHANPEFGIAKLEEAATAAENAGEAGDAKKYREMIARAKSGPNGENAVKDYFTFIIGSIPGGDKAFEAMAKVGKEARERAAEPTVQAQRLAELDFTKAQTAKTLVDARKLGLDADKLVSEIEKMKKNLPEPIELSADAEKLVNNSVMAAAKSNSLAKQYTTLSQDFDKAITNAGVGARITEQISKVLGTEKEPTALRQEYLRLRNTAVLEMLPPGVASDKDVELALAAFPTETSSPANISGFLRGMAKLQSYEAAVESSKAEWIQQNGTLGTAKVSMQVGNREVPKGGRFTEFIQEYIPNTSVIGAGGAAGATFGTVPPGSGSTTSTTNRTVTGDF